MAPRRGSRAGSTVAQHDAEADRGERDSMGRDMEQLEEFRDEVREGMAAMKAQHVALLQAIGHVSDDGKGGSGLMGEVMRLKTDVRGLLDLKTKGMGFVGAVVLFGSLIFLGIKGWLTSLFHVGTPSG